MIKNDTIPPDELDEIYQFAITLGRGAGKLLLNALQSRRDDESDWSSSSSSSSKGEKEEEEDGYLSNGCNGVRNGVEEPREKLNAVDIVTQTDLDVEAYIHNSISTKYPHHDFLGEETYSEGASRNYIIDPSVPTWVVDPLDGTVNFTHGFPMFCVSIGLVHHEKVIIGVICAPMLNQLFSACIGKGAWLNETMRLPMFGNKGVGPIPSNAPGKCIFGCEWGKDRRDRPEGNLLRKINTFVNMAAENSGRGGLGGMVHGMRSLGSATMDLAYTAMGSVDLWWEGGCWEWDVAAGICLLQEAGGLITTANPPKDWETCKIEDAKLGGRLYLAVRPASDGPTETARQSQERAVREVWRRVIHLDYSRPGVNYDD